MKKVIIILLILFFVSGCYKESLIKIREEKLVGDIVEIYKVNENTIIFTDFIADYQDKDKLISLKDAFETKKITIDEIMAKMEYVDALNDGGSVIFKYDTKMNNLASQDLYLVSCKKLNSENISEKMYQNENIYLSNKKDLYNITNYCDLIY